VKTDVRWAIPLALLAFGIGRFSAGPELKDCRAAADTLASQNKELVRIANDFRQSREEWERLANELVRRQRK